MTEHYDIIIVGGGMVGATLACSLGNSDLRIALIEDKMPQEFSAEQRFDLRVSALSIASRTIMETIGAWAGIADKRLCPFRRMRVWEEKGNTEFLSDEINQPELGYIVENRVIQLALLERLRDFSNIDFLCPVKPKRIKYDSKQSTLELAEDENLTCRLLVAADGGQSLVRQSSGMGVSGWDYKQHALVVSVETAYPQQDITWQRFVETGPQAFLPSFMSC